METLIHGGLRLELARFPLRHGDPLRAWDAADEYILQHLEELPLPPGSRVLVIGDAFGALTCALSLFAPTHWSDSFLSREAARFNLGHNGLAPDVMSFVTGECEPQGPFDLVLIKPPKSLDALTDLLRRLRPALGEETRIVLGSMIKHTPGSVYRTVEQIIGPTVTGLGWKKARLAIVSFDPDACLSETPPNRSYDLEGLDLRLSSRPGVFSGDRLDFGTGILLRSLPQTEAPLRAVDLGCGNGVLGLALARQCPRASVIFVDESDQAVANVRENASRADLGDRDFEFRVADGLADQDFDSIDLILCNPPFHQAQAVGDQIAWRMFEQAKRALCPGGDLLVVGNRHLGYHVKLKRLFGQADVIDSDERFIVMRARFRSSG